MESAIYMSKIANEVTLIHRRDEFRAEQILQDRAKETSNIKYIYNAKIASISEDNGLVAGVCYSDKKTFEKLIHPTDGIIQSTTNISTISTNSPITMYEMVIAILARLRSYAMASSARW